MKHLGHLFFFSIALCISMQLNAVTYCAPSAWGYGAGATGGGSASPTLVKDASGLKNAIAKGSNKVVIITQDITVSGQISSTATNITIMAVNGAKLISTQQNSDKSGILYLKGSNIILRNLTFEGPGAYDCDGNDNLCLDGATKVWVDHCDFQDGCDGNFDIKGKSDNISVTWCRFRYLKKPKAGGSGGADDHRFTNLVGSDSSDKPGDGTYNITYGYCWWDEGCKQRMTRCRNASQHFLNCYWNSSVADYYIGPENADCYIEGCVFDGKPAKSKIFYENYSGKNGAKFINCTSKNGVPSNVSNRTVLTPTYSYTALTAAEAKTAITNTTCGAGATLTVTEKGAVSSSCDGNNDNPTPMVYTVTWNATDNGGTCSIASTKVTEGEAIGTLPTATRSGYTFNGWYTSATGGTKITTATVVTKNVTYYAQFTLISGGENTDTPVTSNLTWNFSTTDFTVLEGAISTNTTVKGLTIVANSSKPVTLATSEKTINDITFTHTLKFGGSGNADYRHLSFDVTGKCTIEVYLISANTSEERTLNIYSGSFGGTLLTTMPAALTATKQTYDYTGGASTITMGSANSGINLYAINLIYPTTGDDNTGDNNPGDEDKPTTPTTPVEGDCCINLGLGEEPTVANGGIPADFDKVVITAELAKGTWENGFLNMGGNADIITFDFSAYNSTITAVTFDVTIPNWTSEKNTIAYHWNNDENTTTTVDSKNKQDITLAAPANAKSFTIQRSAGTGTRISQVCFDLKSSVSNPTGLDNTETKSNAIKVIQNGQILIIRDGKTYNLLGHCIE